MMVPMNPRRQGEVAGMLFADRIDAGRRLADRLEHLAGEDTVVLGLPRGGGPVARQIAQALRAPLDVIVVRKLGVPYHPELGMGAIGEGGVRVINEEVVRMAGATAGDLAAVEERERAELERRARRYRGDRPPLPLTRKTAVVVDDGIATGSTARAACRIARAQGAARVVLAVPVAPAGWEVRAGEDADELVCLEAPRHFGAISQFYADFSQTSDEEVIECLRPQPAPPTGAAGLPASGSQVEIPADGVLLSGVITVPLGARGLVVFAHGSGSSRHSPRNRFVAEILNGSRLGTLLFDLLTAEEERDRDKVFDIGLLASRLAAATEWLVSRPEAAGLAIGYFGSSTGAAAALWAAAEPGADIAAVVSRGGRPDLAGYRLGQVTSPTLLVVGEQDHAVLDLNRQAQARLGGETRLAIVPGATHLFEEPGTLQQAAELAAGWFVEHLGGAGTAAEPE